MAIKNLKDVIHAWKISHSRRTVALTVYEMQDPDENDIAIMAVCDMGPWITYSLESSNRSNITEATAILLYIVCSL